MWKNRSVQRAEPSVVISLITNRRYDQQITRASRSDVQHSRGFLEIALFLFFSVFQKLGWRTVRELHDRETAFRIGPSGRLACGARGHISKYYYRKLKPLGFVHSHYPNAVEAFFNDRSIARFAGFGLIDKPVNKRAERYKPPPLTPASHIHKPPDIRKSLLAGAPIGKACM